MLVKNRNFGQKSKFWSKFKHQILVRNRNFGQKSDIKIFKIWTKYEPDFFPTFFLIAREVDAKLFKLN